MTTTKRGKITDIDRFRKKMQLKPLAIAMAGILVSACTPQEEVEVKVVTSIDDCVDKTSMNEEQCQVAYKRALLEAERTAPRYTTMSECIADFGPNACRQSESRSESGSFIMPFMAGWMVSNALDGIGNRQQNYNPVFSNRSNRNSRDENGYTTPGYSGATSGYISARGERLSTSSNGNYKASSTSVKAKAPTVTKTVSRGGFGSEASAKSSWGGKSSSWGG